MEYSERLVEAIGNEEQSLAALQEMAAATFSVCILPDKENPEDATYGLIVFEPGFESESYLIPEKPWKDLWTRYSILAVTDETSVETELSHTTMINHIETLLDQGHNVGIIPVNTMPEVGDGSFERDWLFMNR